MVDDDDNHFSVEDGILMLTSDISGAGKPEGVTLTAIVEVRDKFSTLNSSYEDLAVRVMITAVIMGCHAEETRNFAKAYNRKDRVPPWIAAEPFLPNGWAIAHRYTVNGQSHIDVYTFQSKALYFTNSVQNNFITTSPTSLYDALDFDNTPTGYTELAVNESKDCFAEEVATSYLDVNAPFRSVAVTVEYGVPTVEGRAVTVASASVSEGKQIFSLDNMELANALNELYTPVVIIDDGKVFIIDGSSQNGNRYEYFANNITVASEGVSNNSPHEVIVVDCPPIYEVIAWQEFGGFQIKESDNNDIGGVEGKYVYVAIDEGAYAGEGVYTGIAKSTPFLSPSRGVQAVSLKFSSPFLAGFSSFLANGDYPIKFADHFICESI